MLTYADVHASLMSESHWKERMGQAEAAARRKVEEVQVYCLIRALLEPYSSLTRALLEPY